MNYNTFYSEVGKLLYAVAKADGHIRKNEYEKLKNIVTQRLAPSEMHNDKHGTDTAYYAEFEFDYLEENEIDAEAAFNSFLAFIEKHKTAITPELLDRINKSVQELAGSYRGITSSESTILTTLKKEMKRIFKK
jgi:hypothetical protein